MKKIVDVNKPAWEHAKDGMKSFLQPITWTFSKLKTFFQYVLDLLTLAATGHPRCTSPEDWEEGEWVNSKGERPMIMKNKTIASMELDPASLHMLTQLQGKSQSTSLDSTFRMALAVFDMLLDHQKDGGTVVLRKEGQEDEPVVLGGL